MVCVCVCVMLLWFCFILPSPPQCCRLPMKGKGDKQSLSFPDLSYLTKISPFPQVSKCLVHRSTKLGSWKYCLLVKSPTLDRPLKSQTCLEIYCQEHIDLPKTLFSGVLSPNEAPDVRPCRGQPRAALRASSMLAPWRNSERGFPGLGFWRTLTANQSHVNGFKLTHLFFLI